MNPLLGLYKKKGLDAVKHRMGRAKYYRNNYQELLEYGTKKGNEDLFWYTLENTPFLLTIRVIYSAISNGNVQLTKDIMSGRLTLDYSEMTDSNDYSEITGLNDPTNKIELLKHAIIFSENTDVIDYLLDQVDLKKADDKCLLLALSKNRVSVIKKIAQHYEQKDRIDAFAKSLYSANSLSIQEMFSHLDLPIKSNQLLISLIKTKDIIKIFDFLDLFLKNTQVNIIGGALEYAKSLGCVFVVEKIINTYSFKEMSFKNKDNEKKLQDLSYKHAKQLLANVLTNNWLIYREGPDTFYLGDNKDIYDIKFYEVKECEALISKKEMCEIILPYVGIKDKIPKTRKI